MIVSGRCHCGGLILELPTWPRWVVQCGCSICLKLGALWAYYPDAEVQITGDTVSYVCNHRVIGFHRCPGCGCTTHWQTLGTDFGRMAVNARLLDGFDPAKMEIRVTPGPNPAIFLD